MAFMGNRHLSNQTLPFVCAGLIMKLPIWGQPPDQNCFDDAIYWEVRDPSAWPNEFYCCDASFQMCFYGYVTVLYVALNFSQVPDEEEENGESLAHADHSKKTQEA